MEDYAKQLLKIQNKEYSQEQTLSILLVCAEALDIDTPSEMARQLNKTPKGIKDSNNYRKVKIGKQLFVINGLKENDLPI